MAARKSSKPVKDEQGLVLQRLGSIELLRALPPEEIQALVPFVSHVVFPSETQIIRQGDVGDAIYFIESGSARVQRTGSPEVWHVQGGSVVGEMALLTGETRSANVTAETELSTWRISKSDFDRIVHDSPSLKRSLDQLVKERLEGIRSTLPNQIVWVATAMRALEARYRGLRNWQVVMGIGFAMWVTLFINGKLSMVDTASHDMSHAALDLICGLLLLQGSCEGFLIGVERLGARFRWDGFISGTVGSLLSTLPEFVVIAFLVQIDPVAAFVTTVITIFNNALAFSIYSFFLPKDREGCFTMPRSVTKAGGELLIAGCAITLIVGIVMIVVRVENFRTQLAGYDLLVIGFILIAIYIYYTVTLVRYYAEGQDNQDSLPPDPERLGHDTSWRGIGLMFFLGIGGAYFGGESIGGFAETALKEMHMPTIPTSAALAFFAGISEYIIVYKSHRRGELGIALSNVFGGISQVMFMLLPFGMIVIGLTGVLTGNAAYAIPINVATTLLMMLLFPLFYTLHQYVQQEKNLSNLDAAAMTGVYVLLLYFLLTYPN